MSFALKSWLTAGISLLLAFAQGGCHFSEPVGNRPDAGAAAMSSTGGSSGTTNGSGSSSNGTTGTDSGSTGSTGSTGTSGSSGTAGTSGTTGVSNDTCASPTPLADGQTLSGDTTHATNDYDPGSGGCTGYKEDGPDLVYAFTPPANGSYTFTLTPGTSAYDAAIYVLSACPAPGSTLSSCIGGEDQNTGGGTETLTVQLSAGTTYFVVVDGFGANGGPFALAAQGATCTSATDGASCGVGQVCHQGACQSGCWIASTYYASSAANPSNACQACDPTASSTTWTAAAPGASCGAGQVCNGSGGCVACQTGSACTPANPCDVGTLSCSGGQPACNDTGTHVAAGASCGQSQACDGNGSCVQGCTIGGTYDAPSTVNPANTCQLCMPASSSTAWTNVQDGTACGAGQYCSAGQCKAGCEITGTFYTTGATNPAHACQVCRPSSASTSWSNAADGTACGTGQACRGGACAACTGGNFLPQVTYSEPNTPSSLALADLNGDGKLDMVVGDSSNLSSYNSIGVRFGNGDGTFGARTPYATSVAPTSLAVGDMNRDGALDLIAGTDGGVAEAFVNNGNGTLQNPASYAAASTFPGTSSVAIADLNHDQWPDIAVADYSGGRAVVLLNRGNGTFQAPLSFTAGLQPTSLAIGDLNGDGNEDIAIANAGEWQKHVGILLGNGDGTFRPQIQQTIGHCCVNSSKQTIRLADFNGDGKLDIALADGYIYDDVTVLLGNGDGTFQSPAHYSIAGAVPSSMAVGDINGDGKPDIAVVSSSSNAAYFFLNNGDGTFRSQVTYVATDPGPVAIEVGDLNRDGLPDLVVANGSSGDIGVFINSCFP